MCLRLVCAQLTKEKSLSKKTIRSSLQVLRTEFSSSGLGSALFQIRTVFETFKNLNFFFWSKDIWRRFLFWERPSSFFWTEFARHELSMPFKHLSRVLNDGFSRRIPDANAIYYWGVVVVNSTARWLASTATISHSKKGNFQKKKGRYCGKSN